MLQVAAITPSMSSYPHSSQVEVQGHHGILGCTGAPRTELNKFTVADPFLFSARCMLLIPDYFICFYLFLLCLPFHLWVLQCLAVLKTNKTKQKKRGKGEVVIQSKARVGGQWVRDLNSAVPGLPLGPWSPFSPFWPGLPSGPGIPTGPRCPITPWDWTNTAHVKLNITYEGEKWKIAQLPGPELCSWPYRGKTNAELLWVAVSHWQC